MRGTVLQDDEQIGKGKIRAWGIDAQLLPRSKGNSFCHTGRDLHGTVHSCSKLRNSVVGDAG